MLFFFGFPISHSKFLTPLHSVLYPLYCYILQLCNHPSLVVEDDSANNLDRRTGGRAKKKISYAEEEKSSAAPGADGIAKFMPYEAMGGGRNAPVMPELSGKMFVLWRLMREMRKPGNGADVSLFDGLIMFTYSQPRYLKHFFFACNNINKS